MNRSGLSLIEVLFALAVIGIAFVALAFSQLTSLRASVNSRFVTEAKAAATQVLEQQMAEVLKVVEVSSGSDKKDQEWVNSDGEVVYRSFYFIDYYYLCPEPDTTNAPRTSFWDDVECEGEVELDDEPMTVNWSIEGEGGVLGEGVVTVTVTARHDRDASITLVDVITCYDVYPSPTSDTPKPCPTPTADGGGRNGD